MANLIDGVTPLPVNGETGWGNVLNAAINAIDNRFTWTGGQAVAKAASATTLTGATLASNVLASSLTSVGTLTSLVVAGDLTVNGTTTTINSTTLTVDDKNIELGSVTSPTDTTANGGGITLKGATDKTLNWVQSTTAWTSSEDFNLLTGKVYEINGTSVLSATTLGSGVTGSSLTSVGTIGTGTWQGTAIAGQYGGTGVANTGKTITVSGNTTIGSSTHTVAFVTSGNTSVTLPATGTLVNDAVTSLSSLATVGTITSGTWNGSTIALARGGTGSTTAPGAMANLMGYTSTATAGGTTTLTNTSSYYQQFTGSPSLGQTVVLPVTSTLQTGWTFHIVNNSTGTLTVNSSGGNLVISVPPGTTAMVTCIGTALTTAADWESGLTDFSSYTGTGNVVLATQPILYTLTVSNTLDSLGLSFDLINTTATTVNFAGAATALTIGATTGTTTVRNGLTVTGPTILGPAVLTQQSTNYTLALADAGDILEMTNTSAATVTIPANGTTAFPIGTQITVIRNNAGVQFVPATDVILLSDSSKQYLATQYSAGTLIKRATNTWYLIGNLSAS